MERLVNLFIYGDKNRHWLEPGLRPVSPVPVLVNAYDGMCAG